MFETGTLFAYWFTSYRNRCLYGRFCQPFLFSDQLTEKTKIFIPLKMRVVNVWRKHHWVGYIGDVLVLFSREHRTNEITCIQSTFWFIFGCERPEFRKNCISLAQNSFLFIGRCSWNPCSWTERGVLQNKVEFIEFKSFPQWRFTSKLKCIQIIIPFFSFQKVATDEPKSTSTFKMTAIEKMRPKYFCFPFNPPSERSIYLKKWIEHEWLRASFLSSTSNVRCIKSTFLLSKFSIRIFRRCYRSKDEKQLFVFDFRSTLFQNQRK